MIEQVLSDAFTESMLYDRFTLDDIFTLMAMRVEQKYHVIEKVSKPAGGRSVSPRLKGVSIAE